MRALCCHRWYLIALLVFCTGISQAQSTVSQDQTLVIAHPTKNNLESLAYLIRENILPLPSDIRLQLVYHTAEQYDYRETIDYLKDNPLPRPFEIIPLDCNILPDRLFTENACSESFRNIFESSDGIIFWGGPDLVPSIYGEETHLMTVVTDPFRHYWEASLLFHLLGGSQDASYPALLNQRTGYAILGICLGMQTMNVATGGTMVQDIPSEIYQANTVEEILGLPDEIPHRNYFTNLYPGQGLDWGHFHPVRFENAANVYFPAAICEQNPAVLSSHHQAAEALGKDMLVLARSMDGKVVEILAHKRFPHVLGLQFHPEVPGIYDMKERFRETPDDKEGFGYQQRFQETKGMEFHRAVWSLFGKWVSSK